MTEPGTLALAWRLAVAVFAIVVPTISFLGLIGGLERIRDDDLITEWVAVDDDVDAPGDRADDVLDVLASGLNIAADEATIRCPHCGATNEPDASACGDCFMPLR